MEKTPATVSPKQASKKPKGNSPDRSPTSNTSETPRDSFWRSPLSRSDFIAGIAAFFTAVTYLYTWKKDSDEANEKAQEKARQEKQTIYQCYALARALADAAIAYNVIDHAEELTGGLTPQMAGAIKAVTARDLAQDLHVDVSSYLTTLQNVQNRRVSDMQWMESEADAKKAVAEDIGIKKGPLARKAFEFGATLGDMRFLDEHKRPGIVTMPMQGEMRGGTMTLVTAGGYANPVGKINELAKELKLPVNMQAGTALIGHYHSLAPELKRVDDIVEREWNK